jgi:hypothetical protein
MSSQPESFKTIRVERYQCLRRLLRDDDIQFLKASGFARLARQKRAADRLAFLRIVDHLAIDMRRVASARKLQMAQDGQVDMQGFLLQRLETNMQLNRLRMAAALHFAHVPAACRVAEESLALIEHGLRQTFAPSLPALA